MAGILDVIGRRRLFGANGDLNDRLRMVGVTPWNTNRNPVRMAGGLDSSTQTLAAGISPSAEPVPHQLRFAPGGGQAAAAQIGHDAAGELAAEQSGSDAAKPGPFLPQRVRDIFGDYRRRLDEHLSRTEGQGIGPRMAKGVGRTLVGVPETMADVAAPPETTGEKIAAFMPGGLVLKRAVIDPAIAEERTALQRLKEGRYSEAAGHALAGSLPLVGPWAANLGERAGQGDIAGAAGEAGTVLLLPKITGRIAGTVGAGMRNAAYRAMNGLLGTRASAFNLSRMPGRGVVEEGIIAGSKPSLLEKVKARSTARNAELNELLQRPENAAKSIDVRPSIEQPIDARIKEGLATIPKLYLQSLRDLRRDLTLRRSMGPEGLEYGMPKRLADLSPREATELRHGVARDVHSANTPYERDLNAARKEIYGNLKQQISGAVPESAEINERIADLASAEKALESEIAHGQGNNVLGLGDVAAAAGGAALDPAHPFRSGVALGLVKKSLGSTPAVTGGAQLLNFGGMALQSPLVPLAAGAAGLRPTLRRRLLEVGYGQNQ